MKILQINAVYKNASTGRTCYELCNYLNKNGHECFTIYGNQNGNYKDTFFVGNVLTQKLHALFSRITGKIGYFSRYQTKKVIRFIKQYQPDVVHLRNLHGNFICIPKLLKFLGENDIPTVVTLHDCFFYTGACTHYTVNNCHKWQTKCENCKYNKLTWFFDRTSKMFLDKQKLFGNINRLAVVGVSKWITSEAMKSPILKNATIMENIYNGIDLSVFKETKSDFKERNGLQNYKIILGVASGWSEKKGLNVFLELADKLQPNEKIVLVGNTLEKIVSDKIVSIAATNNVEELVKIYNAADVFVQASKEETFGKVVAEALACGVPVVTNMYTANPEMVDDKSGVVVADFTADNIYKTISYVLKKRKEDFSCRQRAEQLFNKDNVYTDYLMIYKRITTS